jgi:hypothetical protein
MPRNNEKPFPCKECRFAINANPPEASAIYECRRNPPSVDCEGQAAWPIVGKHDEEGCFAGEPKVQRSCRNCKIDSTCFVRIRCNGQEICTLEDWHCSEWEAREAS